TTQMSSRHHTNAVTTPDKYTSHERRQDKAYTKPIEAPYKRHQSTMQISSKALHKRR
ncbi:8861_t:CDS:1, partial [Gigaspora rosea]